jgi:hypothetical protein
MPSPPHWEQLGNGNAPAKATQRVLPWWRVDCEFPNDLEARKKHTLFNLA